MVSYGDLRDINVGSSANPAIHNCLYTSPCGSSCAAAPTFGSADTTKNIDEVIKNYRSCHRPIAQTNPSPDIERYFIADMSAAYVAYLNSIQDTSGRSTATNQLNEDIKTDRKNLDKQLADIYQLDKGKLNEYKMHYESTLFSGLLWGTLAATVTYYVLYS
jgi:hypothetical protein